MRWFSDNGPAFLALLGTALAALGTYWAAHQQTNHERDLRTKTEEIAELNRMSAEKSDKIAELTHRLLASVTGGQSFCYVTLVESGDRDNPVVTLVHQGEHPLYDVHVRIVDLEKWNEGNRKTLKDISKSATVFNAGNLAPGRAQILGAFHVTPAASHQYNIFISARNGSFTEKLRLHTVEGRWKMATRVVRDHDTKILFEKVDPVFPRDKDGIIRWD